MKFFDLIVSQTHENNAFTSANSNSGYRIQLQPGGQLQLTRTSLGTKGVTGVSVRLPPAAWLLVFTWAVAF